MNKFQRAIDYRKVVLARWEKNPPKGWSAEYLAENIKCVLYQIYLFEKD